MKKVLTLIATVAVLCSCGSLKNLDKEAVASATAKTLTAASLRDADIIALSQQTVHYMDSTNVVLGSGSYVDRLNRLTKDIKVDGLDLAFKVYKTDEINAFACGDGSIRVYSGLMDVMDDDALMAIIGHEIGHVVHKDTKAAMKRAYLASAARDMAYSVGGVVATLSSSLVGDLAEKYVEAKYSQKQEYNADAYGFQFAIDAGRDKYSMYKALNKLVDLSGNSGTTSRVAQMFASHPDSAARAAKVKAMADAL